jgi:hypothetical protein
MTVGRLLDRIWAILRGHARLFLKLSAMPAVATLAMYAVMIGVLAAAGVFHAPQPPDPNRLVWILLPEMLIIALPMMVVFAVSQAAVCDGAIAANRGVAAACGDLYRKAWSKAGRYTWLTVLCWLILMAPMLAGFALVAVAGALSGRMSDGNVGAWFVLLPLMLLLYAGGFVYMIWMMLRLGLAFPACVTEDLTAWEAVQRSGRLTNKAKGRMFLVLLVVYAISYAAVLVLEMLAFAAIAIVILIGAAFHMHMGQPLAIAGLVVAGIVFLAAICLFSALMWAAYAVTLSVLYEDQVLRMDGPPPSPALMSGGTA